MTGQTIQRRFDDRERERLGKLFSQLGTDNQHEAEAARSRIDALLRQFDKTWSDLIGLLGGDTPVPLRADLARDIVALGSSDPDERANAWRNIADLLARHRKSWNDLVDVLCTASHEAWACDSPANDLPRVNPLKLVHYLLAEYVALQPHQYVAVALWILHTHIYDRFTVTPRQALCSPVADCGKTTLIDVMSRLTARPAKFDSITTAALYRVIDQTHPTLLIDEADNLGLALRPNGRLRAVFNSGHRSGGTIAIVEGGSTRRFSTFAPLALALPEMRGLPRTLNSRSISITMERSQRRLRPYGINHPDPALDVAYGRILLWQREVKLNPDPEMPAALRNRFADNWRPLIATADSLGWGKQAREAMMVFAREYQDADAKILLLRDIRRVFDMSKADRLPSKTLLDALYGLDGGESWSEFSGVRGEQQPHKLRSSELASMLRDFRIKSRVIWPANRTATSKSAKGYLRRHFEDAWSRYCSDDVTASHASNIKALSLVDDDTA
jgi:hypothetical protein